ncbi:MAG: SDR family NAD(P)-dependent oxidoreductase, partial [Betaproteobacteria bacterium]
MNILLTGGAGYIGSHTAVALSTVGHRVVILDNFCNSQPEAVQRIQQITGQLITVVRGDIRDTSLVNHTLQYHGIDAVIHFAGLKAVGE